MLQLRRCLQHVMATLPHCALLHTCLRTSKYWCLLSRDTQDALLEQGVGEVALFSLAFEPTRASALEFLGALGVGSEEDVQTLLDMQVHSAPLAMIERQHLAAVSDTDIAVHAGMPLPRRRPIWCVLVVLRLMPFPLTCV